MKKLLLSFCLLPLIGISQVCNPSGNMMLFSNYDGGVLNINIDANIPNLKIGVVTYEGTTINLSGAFVNNVTAVYYAGYNASNGHCGSVINTSINGAPVSANSTIAIMPASTLSNPNGYNNIICAYSCDNTTSQGGCNTIDQVEAFFQTQFGGSLYAHYVQYNCWSGSYNLSLGGTCCPAIPLGATTNSVTNSSCFNSCNGTADLTAFGGTPPYTYTWGNGDIGNPLTGVCAGIYNVVITDVAGGSYSTSVTITEPSQITATFVNSNETGACDGISTAIASGGTPSYSYLWDDPSVQTTATADGLCQSAPCVTITDVSGCIETLCTTILSVADIDELQADNKQILKIIDVTGRETQFRPNTVLIYIYNDGSHQRILVNE